MEHQNILAVLEKHPEINTAYVIGSITTGCAKPKSDLDIAVKVAASLTTEQHIALVGNLALATGRAIDLVT